MVEFLTCAQVTRLAESPNAYRAAENILNKNYEPKIPCHRAIKNDGKIGGYDRGVNKKKELLDLLRKCFSTAM